MLSSGRLNRFGTSAWSKPMAFHAKVVRVFTRALESRRSPPPSESRWHRAVAPGVDLGEITTHGLALSRLKHGFESRREGPKEVRSSLRRQSFSSDSKREVIVPALDRTRRVSHPRRGNFGKRRVACGEAEKARGLLTGWSRTAGLSSGRWRPSPTALS